ncbi:hypothetical protein HDK77DRAFT_25031 [Phyllosticta capitalensis]
MNGVVKDQSDSKVASQQMTEILHHEIQDHFAWKDAVISSSLLFPFGPRRQLSPKACAESCCYSSKQKGRPQAGMYEYLRAASPWLEKERVTSPVCIGHTTTISTLQRFFPIIQTRPRSSCTSSDSSTRTTTNRSSSSRQTGRDLPHHQHPWKHCCVSWSENLDPMRAQQRQEDGLLIFPPLSHRRHAPHSFGQLRHGRESCVSGLLADAGESRVQSRPQRLSQFGARATVLRRLQYYQVMCPRFLSSRSDKG